MFKSNLHISLIVLISLIATQSYSQFGFEYDDSIIVKYGSDTLLNPWAGGLNYAQFSDFDYDLDGDMDLFVFDRSSNSIRVFTQESGPNGPYYKYKHGAKDEFPPDLKYRATLVDYDNDGKKDLFTWAIGGMRVYRNVSTPVSGLQWSLYQDIIYTEYAVAGNSNLNVSSDDIPGIVDVDFDGDIDFLTGDLGGRRIEYHQNQSMDLYGIPDSIILIQKNECWGKFSEDMATNLVILNDPNPPCVGGNIPNPERNGSGSENSKLHSASTLLAIDIDSSGVLDLIIGDDSYDNLIITINGGTAVNSDSPMISFDDAFPSNTIPVKCNLFPGAFYIDVDFDGIKDLVVSPNSTVNSFNVRSVFYYKNLGSNAIPVFVYMTDNFLQDGMIETGSGSIPVLFDMNEDGLQDLMVANNFRYKPILDKESTVSYYINTGTATSPEFQYVDYDVFNFNAENYGLRSVPTFGDLDDDGDEDMLVGLEDGTLVYYENTSVGSGAVFTNGIMGYMDNQSNVIQVNGFCHPQLFDLDNDGLLDLILGTETGSLVYYNNIGTAANPSFNMSNSTLGNIDIVGSLPNAMAAPHFFRHNGDTRLFIGSNDGTLFYYDSIDGNLNVSDIFELISNSYLGINVDGHSSFWVEDLDNDGNLNMFVGQDLGGIIHYEVDSTSSIGISELKQNSNILIFPNPSEDVIHIEAPIAIRTIELLDLKGRIVKRQLANSSKLSLKISDLASGIYAASIHLENGEIITKKLLIQ